MKNMIPLVLSVDDDRVTQMLNKIILGRSGFCERIVPLMDGQQALSWLRDAVAEHQALPNLILLDINMPVMGGWEFLDAIDHYFNKYEYVNIVMLSSSINPDDEQKAQQYKRIISYLTKPLTMEMMDLLKQHKALHHFFNEPVMPS
jgi:CheY-like chemotaxis protein